MAVELADAYISLIPTVKNLGRNISRELDSSQARSAVNQSSGRLGKRFSTGFITAIGAAGVAGVALGRFLGGATQAASDLAETVNRSGIVFGDNAREIDRWASGAAKSFGLSKQAALDAASNFGNMFSQLGFGADQASAMSQQVVQMSADLGSFNNLPTADVAERISAAFRGEYDSLQLLIPNINAARVEQEALGMTGKTSAADLTAAEKAAATLAIVQRDGAAAAGDFARTSDGLANSQKIAAAQAEDLKARIGTALVPVMQTLVSIISEHVLPALEGMFSWFAANPTVLKIVAAIIGITLVGAFVGWAASIWAANAALLANPITWIVLLLAGLVAGVVLAWQRFETFRNVVTGAWAAIQTAASFAWNNILKPVFSFFGSAMRVAWETARTLASVVVSAWQSLSSGVSAAYTWLRDNVLSPIIGWFQRVWEKARDVASGVTQAFTNVKDTLKAAFEGIWNAIKGPLNVVIGGINDFIITPINKVTGVFGIDPIGKLDRLHSGGFVPGRGEKPYLLLGGEAVLNPAATRALGKENIDALNRGEAMGGPVDWAKSVLDAGKAAWNQIGDWLKEGAAFALGKVIDLGTAGIRALPGDSFAEEWVAGGFGHFKNSIVAWGKGKDAADEGSTAAKGAGALSKSGWAFPLRAGSFRVGRGPRGHGYLAWDFPAPIGTPVYAPFAGSVKQINLGNRSYGRHLRLGSAGREFLVAHLSGYGKSGVVGQGDLIGRVGSTGNSTGPHAHIETRLGGARVNPKQLLKFDRGYGVLDPGMNLVYNGTGGPEPLVDPRRRAADPQVLIQTFGTPQALVSDVMFSLQARERERMTVRG